MRALDKKLVRDLRRMWTQALSIGVITMIGTAAYIILVGTASSIQQTQISYYEAYRFANVFAQAQYVPNHAVHRLQEINGVGKVSTGIAQSAVVHLPHTAQPATCQATTLPQEGGLNQLYIRSGRMPSPGSQREVVVSESFAKANNLGPGDVLNVSMRGNRYRLQVVGLGLSPEYVFFAVPGAMVPDDKLFGVLWLSREFMEVAFEYTGGFNKVALSVVGDANANDVVEQVDQVLSLYGGTGSFSREDHMSHANITGQIEQLRDTVKYAAPIFIGVVAFLLHMVMKRHIETEREQIGSFKAFGYSNGDIILHYLKFVLVIVLSGLVVGMLVGARVGELATIPYTRMFHFPYLEYVLDPLVFVEVTLIQLGAALIGSMHSLWQAANLPPAVAMRPAPPPVYKRTGFETLVQRYVTDQPSRMIMRHIIRWPLRSIMTVFAISGAMAVLVAPLGTLSSSEHMVDLHFFHAERQDMTVPLGRTPLDKAARDAMHLPGVQTVEPFRNGNARIYFNGLQRKISVLGRPYGNQLSRPLEKDGSPLTVPKDGIVISRALAEWMGATKGDYITLKFLEGRKTTVVLPITGLAESHNGVSFFLTYVNLDRLNDMLREGNVISGFHLNYDPLQEKELFKELKGSPAMVATITHAGALAAMRRGQESKLRMTWLNLAIAAMIVFGAVYNSARISLAERSRELAGMRLLGYTRSEVSYILLGELALLSLMALPLGSFLGYYLALLLTEGTSNATYRMTLYFEAANFGYAILAVMAMVLLSGAFMTKKIFNLDLITTLKTKE